MLTEKTIRVKAGALMEEPYHSLSFKRIQVLSLIKARKMMRLHSRIERCVSLIIILVVLPRQVGSLRQITKVSALSVLGVIKVRKISTLAATLWTRIKRTSIANQLLKKRSLFSKRHLSSHRRSRNL
jgi:hypothetical protein